MATQGDVSAVSMTPIRPGAKRRKSAWMDGRYCRAGEPGILLASSTRCCYSTVLLEPGTLILCALLVHRAHCMDDEWIAKNAGCAIQYVLWFT